MSGIGWLDASSGVSGDMLLGALVDAGVPIEIMQAAIDRLGLPEPVVLAAEPVTRAGLAGTRLRVHVAATHHHRRLADVLAVLERLDAPIRERAAAVFRALATAEAVVHRTSPDEVHFHEVGALDSIADVVGAVAGLVELDLDRLVCSPIALGGGHVRAAHGTLPVPGPAVVELLRGSGVPSHGGPIERELATPTGVAVLVTLADGFGPMPAMVVERTGAGAGTADPVGHPNLLRLVVGSAPGSSAGGAVESGPPVEAAYVLEANVDDLDPRLWPGVLGALLAAGADDAWLTPILMKKGRPAHTLSVLGPPSRADALARVLLTHTSTIGLRRRSVDKVPLPRETVEIEVLGAPVRIKLARLDGVIVSATPEYDDIARLAAATGRAEKVVLAAAVRAAHDLSADLGSR